jgi:hypothetical protein
MLDFVTHVVGWKLDASYHSLSYDVGREWSFEDVLPESVTNLRQAMAIDSRMKALIAHGYTDLSCPFFASQLIIDQMPNMETSPPAVSGVPGRAHVLQSARKPRGSAPRRSARVPLTRARLGLTAAVTYECRSSSGVRARRWETPFVPPVAVSGHLAVIGPSATTPSATTMMRS